MTNWNSSFPCKVKRMPTHGLPDEINALDVNNEISCESPSAFPVVCQWVHPGLSLSPRCLCTAVHRCPLLTQFLGKLNRRSQQVLVCPSFAALSSKIMIECESRPNMGMQSYGEGVEGSGNPSAALCCPNMVMQQNLPGLDSCTMIKCESRPDQIWSCSQTYLDSCTMLLAFGSSQSTMVNSLQLKSHYMNKIWHVALHNDLSLIFKQLLFIISRQCQPEGPWAGYRGLPPPPFAQRSLTRSTVLT